MTGERGAGLNYACYWVKKDGWARGATKTQHFLHQFLPDGWCGCNVLVLVVGVLVSDSCSLLDVGCRVLTVDCRVALLILIPVCRFSVFRCWLVNCRGRLSLFYRRCPRLLRTLKIGEMPLAHQREHSALQTRNFWRNVCASMEFQIPDPDPQTQLNLDLIRIYSITLDSILLCHQ